MELDERLALLKSTGVFITGGHFVYTSGMHGSAYINKDALYPYTRLTSFVEFPLPAWTVGECPLCAQGVPINTTLGKGQT